MPSRTRQANTRPYRTRRFISTFLGLLLLSVLSGCVWKSEHLKMKRQLEAQIAELQKAKNACHVSLTASQKDVKTLRSQLQQKLLAYQTLQKSCTRQKKALDDRVNELISQNKQKQGALNHCSGLLKGKRKQLFALQRTLQQKEKDLHDKAKQLKKLQAQLDTWKLNLKARQDKLDRSMKQIQQLKKELDRLRNLQETLQNQLKKMVQAGDLNIQIRGGMLILQLPEKLLFALNKAKIKPKGRKMIAKMTGVLSKMKARWRVVGHTDSKGDDLYNWRLSARRAMAVLFVMLKAGMSPKQVSLGGYGKHLPVASNQDDQGRAQNRRTELVLVPELGGLLKSALIPPKEEQKEK